MIDFTRPKKVDNPSRKIDFTRPKKIQKDDLKDITKEVLPKRRSNKYIILMLISIIVSLASWNMKLVVDNATDLKTIAKKLAILQMKNKTLKNNNKTLKSKNSKMLQKQRVIKKKFGKHKKRFTKKLVGRAKKKIASAPAKIVPLLGVAAIITMTTMDVNAFCDDINEMNALEKDIFGKVTDNNLSTKITEVCNYDIKKHLSPQLQEQYDETAQYIGEKYKGSLEWFEKQSNENNISDKLDKTVESIEDTYDSSIATLKGFF